MARLVVAAEVDVGTKFRWRATKVSNWEEYTVVGWDDTRDAPLAKCKHGNVDQFNPCAMVEVEYET